MKPVQVSKLVAMLIAAFPTFRLTDATSALYERLLVDLDEAAASAALERLITTAKFPPTIAEIREATLAIACGDRRPGGDAWGDVLAAVSRFGINRDPVFADQVTDRAVRALGWREICLSENQTADRARFIELYDQLAITARRDVVSAGLPAGERYKRLRESGEAQPVSAAIARRLESDTKH